MDTNFLAKAFGVWSGWGYRFDGEIPGEAEPSAWITSKASIALGRNDFVSTVAEIRGSYYFYTVDRLPQSDIFFEIGDLGPTYVPPAEEIVDIDESEEQNIEGENDAG